MSNIKIKFWFDKDGEYGQKNNVYYSQDDGCTWEYLFNAGIGEQGPQGPSGANGKTPKITEATGLMEVDGEIREVPITVTEEEETDTNYKFNFDFGKIIPDIELKFDEETKKWYWYIDGEQSKAPVTGIQKDVVGEFTNIGGTGTAAARLETINPETGQPYYLLTIENLKGEAGREIKIEAVTTEDNNVKIQWRYEDDPPIGSVELVQGKDYQAGRLMNTRQVDNKVELESTLQAGRLMELDEETGEIKSTLQAGRLMELDEETGEIKSTLQAGDNITIDEETGVISASGGGGSTEYIEVTYAEIVQLCNNNQLKIGSKYLITDYEFIPKSFQPEGDYNPYGHIYTLESEGYMIGILTEPLSKNTLNTKCKVQYVRKGTYEPFEDKDLLLWELDYTIKNDTDNFNWANSKGKGVIYRMKTHKCECSYDVLNIIYKINESYKQGIWVRCLYAGEIAPHSRVFFYKRTETVGRYEYVKSFATMHQDMYPQFLTTITGEWAKPTDTFNESFNTTFEPNKYGYTLFVMPDFNKFGTFNTFTSKIENAEAINKIYKQTPYNIYSSAIGQLPFALIFSNSTELKGYTIEAETFMLQAGDIYESSYKIKSYFGFFKHIVDNRNLDLRAVNINLNMSLIAHNIDHCGDVFIDGGQHTRGTLMFKSFKYCHSATELYDSVL